MARKWQVHESKNRSSEVVDLALEEGPQLVMRHGKEVAVVVSKRDFDRRHRAGPRGTIVPFLRSLASRGVDLELERSKDVARDVEL